MAVRKTEGPQPKVEPRGTAPAKAPVSTPAASAAAPTAASSARAIDGFSSASARRPALDSAPPHLVDPAQLQRPAGIRAPSFGTAAFEAGLAVEDPVTASGLERRFRTGISEAKPVTAAELREEGFFTNLKQFSLSLLAWTF